MTKSSSVDKATMSEKSSVDVEQIRKQAEEAVWSERQRLYDLFTNAPVCVAVISGPDLVFELANPPYCKLLGVDRSVDGHPLLEVAPDIEPSLLKIVKNVAFKGERFVANEIPILLDWDNTGSQYNKYFNLIYEPLFDKNKKPDGLIAFANEITEQVLARKKVEESEVRFRQLAETVPQLVWIIQPDGTIEYFNQHWYDYTGTTAKGTLQRKWLDVLHPDDKAIVRDLWATALKSGEPVSFEYRLRAKDGSYHWFLGRGVPQYDEKGTLTKWYGTCTNIDDVKRRYEIEKRMKHLTEQHNSLIKLNKTKDEFIALASHQLRTPATAVKQYVSLLMDEYSGPVTADQLQYLQAAYDNNERQLNIINDLLKTAQLDSSRYSLDKKPHNLVRITREVIGELESAFELKHQVITFKTSDQVIKSIVDGPEIKLVLMNLIENASKYTYPNKQIDVSVQKKNKYIEICVADQGVGIGKDDTKRIFEKFTRIDNDLSDTVNGSGLGLYWVKRIIKLHKGSLKVTSTPKEGSIFVIRLPV